MALSWTMEMSVGPPARAKTDEARLVAASRGGDPGAFAELVHLHQRRVFRLVGRFFRNAQDVEDLAQETFLTVWRKLDTYRSRAPFEHWLTRVCLNCCYARLRKKAPTEVRLETEFIADGCDPDARMLVERLLQHLKPEERFILLLLDGEGWTVAEIADRLGWTTVNVKVRAHRVRKKLRRLLESER